MNLSLVCVLGYFVMVVGSVLVALHFSSSQMDVKVRSFLAVFLGFEQQITVPALHVAGLVTSLGEQIAIVYSVVTSTRLF